MKTQLKFELVRDFIHDCLYNPRYGYFSKNVQILKCSIPFAQLKDQSDYNSFLAKAYSQSTPENEETVIGHDESSLFYKLSSRPAFSPLWHTPSELFQPFYGEAIGNFLQSKLKEDGANANAKANANEKLVIYEIGPGNGTLAENVIDALAQQNIPVEYNLIEISARLRSRQQASLLSSTKNIKFHNWSALAPPADFHEPRPCTIIALEVFDNLPHDLIKYRNEDGVLLEGHVGSNEEAAYGSVPGKLWLEWQECRDSVIAEFVQEAESIGWQSASLRGHSLRRLLERIAPPGSYVNPWSTEFIPTGAHSLLKQLKTKFPEHRLLASDFSRLPEAIAGHNGPVVQTRFRNQSVACSTFLLARGLFDIFFPVNFELIRALHGRQKSGKIWQHREFLEQFASKRAIEATTTQSGYNPMLQDFSNVQFYYG